MYRLENGMLFQEDRITMEKEYLVESINTGTQWRLDESEIRNFFTGRNKKFYRVFKCL